VPREADRAGSGARLSRPSSVGDREVRADGHSGELTDCIAAGASVGNLLIVELLGHVRVPFPGYRPDHPAGVELAAVDAACSGSGGP
jgi:hypothetical protein